jgi:hypothetical protein
MERALKALASKLNGSPAAANAYRRKRPIYAAPKYAVKRKYLAANPLADEDTDFTPPKAVEAAAQDNVGACLRLATNTPCVTARSACMRVGRGMVWQHTETGQRIGRDRSARREYAKIPLPETRLIMLREER